METPTDEIENVIFQALSHPMRRTILRMLEANAGCSYTELITELQLPTGKMNYHLEQLDGLIEKNEQHRYVLSPLGKKALNQLKQLSNELSTQDQNYIKTAARNRRSSLEPTLKSLVITGIAASLIVTFLSIGLAFFLVLQNAFPTVMLFVLVPGIAIETAITGTLIYALKKAPEWLRRLERRFLAS